MDLHYIVDKLNSPPFEYSLSLLTLRWAIKLKFHCVMRKSNHLKNLLLQWKVLSGASSARQRCFFADKPETEGENNDILVFLICKHLKTNSSDTSYITICTENWHLKRGCRYNSWPAVEVPEDCQIQATFLIGSVSVQLIELHAAISCWFQNFMLVQIWHYIHIYWHSVQNILWH
jgi:hypothetical protein